MQKTQLTKIVQPINNSVKSFSGERLYIATKTLKGSKIEFEFSKKVDYENKPSRANQEVEVGDIIFAKMQGTRKTLLIGKSEKEYIFSSGFFVLRADKEILNEYLFHFFNSESFLNQKDINCTGATQKALTLTGLKKIFIPLSPLPQQKQIIQKLDKLTNLIELRKESIKKTEDLTKSIFIEMFGTLEGNEEKWDTEKLNKISKVGTGGTPSRKKEDIYYNGNINWAKTTEVKGEFIYNTEEKITKKAIKDTNCKIYEIDTILLAMYGQGKTRGNVGLLKIEAATNQACAAIVKGENMNQLFLFYLLKFSYEHIRSFGRGGNQPNLNLSLVGNLDIPVPPITLQNKFAEIVKKNEENIRWQKESLGKLEELYDSCMQESFSF